MLKLSPMISIQTLCFRGLWITHFDWARFERLCLALAGLKEKFLRAAFLHRSTRVRARRCVGPELQSQVA